MNFRNQTEANQKARGGTETLKCMCYAFSDMTLHVEGNKPQSSKFQQSKCMKNEVTLL